MRCPCRGLLQAWLLVTAMRLATYNPLTIVQPRRAQEQEGDEPGVGAGLHLGHREEPRGVLPQAAGALRDHHLPLRPQEVRHRRRGQELAKGTLPPRRDWRGPSMGTLPLAHGLAPGFTSDIAKHLGESFYRPWVPFVTIIFLCMFGSKRSGRDLRRGRELVSPGYLGEGEG